MPKRDDLHMQRVRAQILEAAQRCISRSGYAATSIRDICDESGLSIGAIYLHFKNKPDILGSLLQRATEERDNRIDSESLEDLESRLTELVLGLDDPAEGDLMRFDLMLLMEAQTDSKIGDHLRGKLNTLEDRLLRVLQQCLGETDISHNALRLAAARLQYIILGGAIKMLAGGTQQKDTCVACMQAEFAQLRELSKL